MRSARCGGRGGRQRAPLFPLSASLLPLVLLLALAGCEREAGFGAEAADLPVGNEVGERAPPLVGTLVGGERFQLGGERGTRGTVLVFYRGLHCGLCRERLRELEAHRSAYGDARVRVLAVTLDPSEEAERTPQELGLGFPVVRVDTAAFAEWGVLEEERGVALPASILLDGRGVIRFRHVGRNAADRARDIEILAVVQEMLAE